MTQRRLSDLPESSELSGDEIVVGVQDEQTVKIPIQSLVDMAGVEQQGPISSTGFTQLSELSPEPATAEDLRLELEGSWRGAVNSNFESLVSKLDEILSALRGAGVIAPGADS